MKIVCASDSFKGTLTSERAAELTGKAAREVFGDVEFAGIPVADGGEGTALSVTSAAGGDMITAKVHDPLTREINASYGMLGDGRAIIETAAAGGLTLLSEDERDPLLTTSYGTGELIMDALRRGTSDICIALGGSATNDGGMGCMRALGIRFTDNEGRELEGRGADLERVSSIDMSGLDQRVSEAHITVMCDVRNPLTGPDGATYVYGPQKGADGARLERLEHGMINYRDAVRELTGIDCDSVAGAGAAGGLGAAFNALLGAELRPGIEAVLDLTDFDNIIKDADLVITGEGRADSQSLSGKAMQGVGMRAKAQGVPVTAIVGSLGEGWEGLLSCGIDRVIPLAGGEVSTKEAKEHTEEIYYLKAREYFLTLRQSMV